MKLITKLLFLAGALTTIACQTDPVRRNAERAEECSSKVITRTMTFRHQNAMTAANYARKEFGCPPMQGEVRVRLDRQANSWVVSAIAPDMARMEEIAARYDQPGEPLWNQQ